MNGCRCHFSFSLPTCQARKQTKIVWDSRGLLSSWVCRPQISNPLAHLPFLPPSLLPSSSPLTALIDNILRKKKSLDSRAYATCYLAVWYVLYCRCRVLPFGLLVTVSNPLVLTSTSKFRAIQPTPPSVIPHPPYPPRKKNSTRRPRAL